MRAALRAWVVQGEEAVSQGGNSLLDVSWVVQGERGHGERRL